MNDNAAAGTWKERPGGMSAYYLEVRAMLALALPVMAGQIGLTLMAVIDALMVRPLGPAALAAVGVGEAVHMAAIFFGGGVLYGLDTMVSRAFGARRLEDCRSALVQGLWVATGLALVLWTALQVVAARPVGIGVASEVAPLAAAYVRAISWGLWPTLLFVALRQTLQSMDEVRAANTLLLVANVVNAGANWWLIYGGPGVPALGVEGAAWATTASRFFLFAALLAWVWRRGIGREDSSLWRSGQEAERGCPPLEPRQGAVPLDPFCIQDDDDRCVDEARWSFAFDRKRSAELLRLGLPVGLFFLLEIGTFSVATMLVGRLGPVPTAAHHIAFTVEQLAWLLPVGLNAAAAVRVGQAVGRGDEMAVRRAALTALGIGIAFSVLTTVAFVVAWRPILTPFAGTSEVLELSRWLLLCTGIAQVFDAAQTTLSGALRGAGDTLRPMIASLIGHWLIALPLGAYLCFETSLGVVGLWIGVGVGNAAVAVWLGRLWITRVRPVQLASSPTHPAPCNTNT